MVYDRLRRQFVGFRVEWAPQNTDKWRAARGEPLGYRSQAELYIEGLRARHQNRWYRIVPVVRDKDGTIRND